MRGFIFFQQCFPAASTSITGNDNTGAFQFIQSIIVNINLKHNTSTSSL